MSFLNFIRKYICCGKNIICKRIFLKGNKLNPNLYSRIGYIFLFFLLIIYSIFLYFVDDILLAKFKDNLECLEHSNDSMYTCLEISSSYRISFAFLILHLICFIICSLENKTMKIIMQNEIWLLKILFLAVIYYFSLYVSNNIFNKFAIGAKIFSVFYLLYQLFLNIYFAHILNFKLIYGFDNYKGKKRYKYGIIILTLVFFLISIYFLVLSLFNYENNWYNITVIILNVALGLLNLCLSISSVVEDKRLLTSLCIFSYSCYITWSALNSQPFKVDEESINTQVNKNNTNLILEEKSIINVLTSFVKFNTTFDNSTTLNISNYYNDNYLIWNFFKKICNNFIDTDEQNLILDFNDSIFGLIYVLIALVFVGFFIKKNYNGYDPFGTDSELNSQINLSCITSEEYKNKEQQILETCNTLATELEYRYNEGMFLFFIKN